MKNYAYAVLILAGAVIGVVILMNYKKDGDEPAAPSVSQWPDCTKTLKKGSKGIEVTALQKSINKIINTQVFDNDYLLVTDGIFGAKTEASLVYILDVLGDIPRKQITLNEFPDQFSCK